MRHLLSASLVLAAAAVWVPSRAVAQDCPPGTEYEVLWVDTSTDTTHYRCADRACEAAVDRDIEAAATRCEDLRRRVLHFPDVEAHLERVTSEQLRRAREDLTSDLVVMFDELQRAVFRGNLDAPAQDSLRVELERMKAVIRRGGDLRELRPFAAKAGRMLKALGLVDLSADLHASWNSLERLIQQETDAERLRGMLEVKKLNLEIQLGACSQKLGEAQERRRHCSRS